MRIAIDLQACQSSVNGRRGIGRYSMALAKAMLDQGRGHEFLLLLSNAFPQTIAPIRRELNGRVADDAFRFLEFTLPLATQDPANQPRARAAERLREARIAGWQPDFVHLGSLFEGLSDDVVTSIGQIDDAPPAAVTLYDLIPQLRSEHYLANPVARQWYERKLTWLGRARLLLAISEATRRDAVDLVGIPADRVVVIHGAADPMFRVVELPASQRVALQARYGIVRPFVLYTGGIDLRKNIEGLIAAFACLPADLRGRHQLAIVCEIKDADRKRLLGLAARAELAPDSLVLTGFVPDADLVALYNTCTLFVFPSLLEGLGLPVLEAMACGAPVIGSDTSSIPEVIGRGDALFDPKRPEAIAASIAGVLNDPEFALKLRSHGRQHAAKFTWRASAERALEAMEAAQASLETPRAASVAASRPPVAAEVHDDGWSPRAAIDAAEAARGGLQDALDAANAAAEEIAVLVDGHLAATAAVVAAATHLAASLAEQRDATALQLEQVGAELQAERTAHAEARRALRNESAGHRQARDDLDRLRAELAAEALSHTESRRMLQDEAAGHNDLRAHLQVLRGELQAQRTEKLQALERLRAVEADLSILQRSRSWRVTAPLRTAVRTLRALRSERDDGPGIAPAIAAAASVEASSEHQSRKARRVQRDLELAIRRRRDR